jgi:4,5-dihydroxyphthalate decarboxylase
MTAHGLRTSNGGGPMRLPDLVQENGTARLHLSLAVADYDHVRDLVAGVVRPEGIVLTPFVLPIEEIFFRFTKHLEWDVSELSFAKYIALCSQGVSAMVALPIFPSRVFRHSAIYIRAGGPISDVKDLAGKTIGVPEWAQTAGIYVRGMLAETYGLDLASIHWVQAGVNQPGREEKVQLRLPAGVRCESRPHKTLDALLLDGDVDAVISARPPAAFSARDARIARLFPKHREEEVQYWEAAGIFPIMHTVTVRRTVFERHPWVGNSLFKAFEEAKRRSLERVFDLTASRLPLPWAASFADDIRARFGDDPWPYGLEANRPTLDAFCRFANDQGVTQRRLAPEDLFPVELHSTVKV